MRKLVIGLASAAALTVTALPAMAQHHHHFRGFGFGFGPWLVPFAATVPYAFAQPPCGAGYGYGGAPYGAYGAVQPPCAQGLYAYPYPYGFYGPGVRRLRPHVNTK
jgi:hypothetical protein